MVSLGDGDAFDKPAEARQSAPGALSKRRSLGAPGLCLAAKLRTTNCVTAQSSNWIEPYLGTAARLVYADDTLSTLQRIISEKAGSIIRRPVSK